eukprot:TRINITY_DN41229_c0_g1_i1.p1 TRINITY_DN41229_c0_g1~~TRINITY_DN41229_c0_g1_i1.p1  ORF type:complete len:115 (+),score=32.39 TRINITY_DN41229_c0_g1_i1:51-347(+)
MSLELFSDPVVAADGETYERAYIESWIREKSQELARAATAAEATGSEAAEETLRARRAVGILSPMGHGPLRHTRLVVNQTVRRLARQWRDEHAWKRKH